MNSGEHNNSTGGGAPPQSVENGWFTEFITGAERFMNAWFFSEPSSLAISSSSSSSHSQCFHQEHNNTVLSIEGSDVLHQELKLVEITDQSQAIVSEIGCKDTIGQLVMQETFSLEECNNLIELIQSRIVDTDAQPIFWEDGDPSLLPNPNHSSPNHHPNPNFLSLGTSPYWTPEIESSAVTEAKKFIECKKSSPNSNLLRLDFEEQNSPIEVAKSYMRDLPPKQSPLSSPPFHRDGSKVLKRNYETLILGESHDNVRQVKHKLNENFKVNENSIVTAIPLQPFNSQVGFYQEAKEQINNGWTPFESHALDLTITNHDEGGPQNESCSVSKLMFHEDIDTIPSSSNGLSGSKIGKTKPTRNKRTNNKNSTKSRNSKPVTCNSPYCQPKNNGNEETLEKKPVSRPRRGRRKNN